MAKKGARKAVKKTPKKPARSQRRPAKKVPAKKVTPARAVRKPATTRASDAIAPPDGRSATMYVAEPRRPATDPARPSRPPIPPEEHLRRIQRDLQAAVEELRRFGMSDVDTETRGVAGAVVEEGDAAQASERTDLSFAQRERLAARVTALTQALERLERGEYGRCEECGNDIEPQRLQALPTARTCIACQQQRERVGGRPPSL